MDHAALAPARSARPSPARRRRRSRREREPNTPRLDVEDATALGKPLEPGIVREQAW